MSIQEAVPAAPPKGFDQVAEARTEELRFLYKCRRCGLTVTHYRREISQAQAWGTIWDTVWYSLLGKAAKNAEEPLMIEPHRCGEHEIGVADFIGCEPEFPA